VAMTAGVDESGRSDLLPEVSTEPGPSGRSE
jgi:hypothetical protein